MLQTAGVETSLMLIFSDYNGVFKNQHPCSMTQPKHRVFSDGPEVREQLGALGLTPEIVSNVARMVAGAKAEALEIDPANSPGQRAYMMGVRAKRLMLLPLGWRMSRTGGVEATVNDELGIQICYQTVDIACTQQEPRAISGKGAGSRKLIQDGQGELFARDTPDSPVPFGATPKVWVICVSTDFKRLRAEVSCPDAFEGDQFEGFGTRIFVVDEDFGPNPSGDQKPDDGGDAGDFEVRIARK